MGFWMLAMLFLMKYQGDKIRLDAEPGAHSEKMLVKM